MGRPSPPAFLLSWGRRSVSLGRDFTLQEDVQGGASAVIISNSLWNRFDGSSSALGKSNTQRSGLRNHRYPVGFRLLGDADVFTPLAQDDPTILSVRLASVPSRA